MRDEVSTKLEGEDRTSIRVNGGTNTYGLRIRSMETSAR